MKYHLLGFRILAGTALSLGCGDIVGTSPKPLPQALPSASVTTSSFPLSFSVLDPVGDQTGPVDVTSMVMSFDNTTGQYAIVLTADAAHPFVGQFRININLFDPDVGTTNPNPSFFSDVHSDFDLTNPTTTLTFTGTQLNLEAWAAGQRVFTNSLAGTGNPDGVSLFRSSVSGFPIGFLTNEDVIAFRDLAQPAIIQTAVRTVKIEIKPGDGSSPLNPDSRGVLPVAVLSTGDFDAGTVDPATVTLGNDDGDDTQVAERPNGTLMSSLQDVDGDGLIDLVVMFRTQSLVANGDLSAATEQLVLNGETRAGLRVRGSAAVEIEPGAR